MAVPYIPDGYHTVTPYLVVSDVRALIAFAQQAFGARDATTVEGNDGKIMHGEMRIGDSVVMMGEPNEGNPPTSAMLHLYVEDVDATYERALAAGATSTREPKDEFYGDRTAGIRDVWGNQWWMATHMEELSEEEMTQRMAQEFGSAV